MRIKFKKPDPRAGQIVEMDEGRAQAFIDDGTAEKVSGNKAEAGAPENKSEASAPVTKAVNPVTEPAREATARTAGTVTRPAPAKAATKTVARTAARKGR